MTPMPPPGQGPIDPRGAFTPPSPPPGMSPMPGAYPPMMPPGFQIPMPPRQGRGFAGTIFLSLAGTIFGFSLLLNIYLLAFSRLLPSNQGQGNVVQAGDEHQKVAVVPIINTMINRARAEELDKLLKQVEDDADVKALVIRMDTPGGEVTPSDQMYDRILQFRKNRPGVPVVVSMGSLATSGGYYAAMAADDLVAEPTTETVNVGVYAMSLNFSKLMDKWGIEDTTIRATGSAYKTAGSPFRPPTTQETAYLTEGVDAAYNRFKSLVDKGRQGKIAKGNLDTVCNGKAYYAEAALKLGAIDQIGYADDAYKYAAKKANLGNPMVVKYETPKPLLAELLGQPESAKIGGLPAASEIDSALGEALKPRLLYLYQR